MNSTIVFAMFDKKVQAYGRPFSEDNVVQAVRGLEQIVNREDNQIHNYAEDFDLYQIGTFDDKEGKVSPCFPPIFIDNAGRLKKENKNVKTKG